MSATGHPDLTKHFPRAARRAPGRARASACLLALALVPAALANAGSDAEIRALIAALGDSGCRFQRNGRWHDAGAARDHLQRKYDHARRRGLDGTAEDFIERAGSRSSITGRPYKVSCPGQPERPAGEWLRERLARLRGDAGQR